MRRISRFFATLGPIGYLPAPGTMGTIATLPLVYLLSFLEWYNQLWMITIIFIVSFFIIDAALPLFVKKDPSQIILDEVVGFLITCIRIPFCFSTLLAGFLLFRFFDILKPFGIKRLELLSGAWGILLDDCLAGLFANLVLWIMIWNV